MISPAAQKQIIGINKEIRRLNLKLIRYEESKAQCIKDERPEAVISMDVCIQNIHNRLSACSVEIKRLEMGGKPTNFIKRMKNEGYLGDV